MPKRIVIADDEPTVVALAKQKLLEQGYIVETARNGREAWEIINSRPVDLIVTDVVMPVMDGVDLYKELKKKPELSGIPIVIITDNRIFRDSFQTLGVEHFIPKPLDPEKLLHKVDYIFTCADLDKSNKHVLILGVNAPVNLEMAKVLEGQHCIVGKSVDAIDFFHAALIVKPRLILIDVLVKGEMPAREVIRGLKVFGRLRETSILTFTQFSPDEVGNMEVVEQLRQAKNDCLEAGATKYIGRFTPATFWDVIQEYLA
jgi:CheY-like chemotaxis protein